MQQRFKERRLIFRGKIHKMPVEQKDSPVRMRNDLQSARTGDAVPGIITRNLRKGVMDLQSGLDLRFAQEGKSTRYTIISDQRMVLCVKCKRKPRKGQTKKAFPNRKSAVSGGDGATERKAIREGGGIDRILQSGTFISQKSGLRKFKQIVDMP